MKTLKQIESTPQKGLQKRAQKTRQKIIDSSFQLFSTKGYQNVTVDDIAKNAGVSTGAAYRYFGNKKEILLVLLEDVFNNKQFIAEIKDIPSSLTTYQECVTWILDCFVEIHEKYVGFHEELEALRHLDQDVQKLYMQCEDKEIDFLLAAIEKRTGKKLTQGKDRVRVMLKCIEDYCNMIIVEDIIVGDKEFIKQKCIQAATSVLEVK